MEYRKIEMFKATTKNGTDCFIRNTGSGFEFFIISIEDSTLIESGMGWTLEQAQEEINDILLRKSLI